MTETQVRTDLFDPNHVVLSTRFILLGTEVRPPNDLPRLGLTELFHILIFLILLDGLFSIFLHKKDPIPMLDCISYILS